MSLELWLVYLVAAFGLSLTPGPNGLLALSHGASFGWRPTVYTVLGGAIGFLVLIGASLAGMGALLAASEPAFNAAKWVGAAYLVYLGVRLWRAPPISISIGSGTRTHDAFRLFQQGLIVAISNPKGLVFFAAFLPQFMTPGVSFLVNLAVFGGTFVIVEVIYELFLAGLAERLAPALARYGGWFNKLTGTTFIGIGAALASAGR